MQNLNFKSVDKTTKDYKVNPSNNKQKTKRTDIKENNKNRFNCRGRIRYEDGVFCVYIIHGIKIHTIVKLDESLLDFSACDRVYSLPRNDYYPPWTEKKREVKPISEKDKDLVLSLWSRFRLNDIIYGYIDLTTNTFFGDVRKTQRLPNNP